MENEKDAYDWVLNDLAWELYWWVDFFNIAFFKDQLVPIPVISFERTKVTNLGHYVIGRNAFGVRENINLNIRYLNRPMWETLVTLLHEMVHSWQTIYGTPSDNWYHNLEFQSKMQSFGIAVDKRGCRLGIADPFMHRLRQHCIPFNLKYNADGMIVLPPKEKPKGKSKLMKWLCPCGQNVRVGTKKGLFAECTLCGGEFFRVE